MLTKNHIEVLLAIDTLGPATSINIYHHLNPRRSIWQMVFGWTIAGMWAMFHDLEKIGLITITAGSEPVAERGGRPNQFLEVTKAGHSMAAAQEEMRKSNVSV